jgi:hypothetical protein
LDSYLRINKGNIRHKSLFLNTTIDVKSFLKRFPMIIELNDLNS